MPGRPTALVVAAVAAVAVFAVVDSLRSSGEDRAPQDEETVTAPEPSARVVAAEELERRGIGGLLFASVRRPDGCRVEILGLPTLSRSSVLTVASCRIRVSPTGLVAAGSTCDGTRPPRFVAQTGAGIRRLRGCAPAWRPSGRLTFVDARGDVVELVEPCASVRPCLRAVVDASEIRGSIRDLAWMDGDRLAALVAGRFPLDQTLAIFAGGRLVVRERPCCPLDEYVRVVDGLVLVPAGSTVLGFDSAGQLVWRDALPFDAADGRAFTSSPDGRWVASTLGATVQIYREGTALPIDPVELDLRAEDLAWLGGG